MGHPDSDEMTNGEVARRLADVVREVQRVADRALSKDVYDAHRAAIIDRITALEQSRSDNRRIIMAGLITLAGSIVTQIVTVVITLATR